MTPQPLFDPTAISTEQQFLLAKAAALRSLARREQAEAQLTQRLIQQGFAKEVIQAVITYCRNYGWIDNERYGAMAVRAGARKGHGPLKIRNQLRNCALNNEQIEHAFSQPEIDWYELALTLLQRRYRAGSLTNSKDQIKSLRYLLGRGFTQEQARYALTTWQQTNSP